MMSGMVSWLYPGHILKIQKNLKKIQFSLNWNKFENYPKRKLNPHKY